MASQCSESTPSVHPELVEGLYFYSSRKGQGFDKLSLNGI